MNTFTPINAPAPSSFPLSILPGEPTSRMRWDWIMSGFENPAQIPDATQVKIKLPADQTPTGEIPLGTVYEASTAKAEKRFPIFATVIIVGAILYIVMKGR